MNRLETLIEFALTTILVVTVVSLLSIHKHINDSEKHIIEYVDSVTACYD